MDEDWAGCLVDLRSFIGYVFTLSNGALSSTESEYMGLTEAVKKAIYLRKFLSDIGFGYANRITIGNNNLGAQQLSQNHKFHSRSKHIDVKHHFVREALRNQLVDITYIRTDEMPADVLTKGLSKDKHRKCITKMGMQFILVSNIAQFEGLC